MAKIMNEVMDLVHDQSLPTIELLQESFPNNEKFMISISTLLDPRYVFLIYAPLLFALNKRVGHRMILALTLAEWANQILKWLLAGERPYWYVHERANELKSAANLDAGFIPIDELNSTRTLDAPLAQLRQFPVTCELGAGSPSGHSMVTATVWYVLIDAYLKNELPILSRVNYHQLSQQEAANRKQRVVVATSNLVKFCWSVYALMLVAVSLSRVYLACHFPHQCLSGALLGALTARLVTQHAPMERLRKHHFALLTGFMFASALSTYALLRLSGFDPLWSVGKAMRWCVKKEYIHLDTTPFFSMMRYLGFCLGSGLAYDCAKVVSGNTVERRHRQANTLLLVRRLLCALAAVAFGQFLLALPAPKSQLNLFYATSFVIYTIFAYAIAGPIPRLAKRLLAAESQQMELERQKGGQKLKAQ